MSASKPSNSASGISSTRSGSGHARTWRTGWRHPARERQPGKATRPEVLQQFQEMKDPQLTAGEPDQGPKVSIRVGCLKCGDIVAAQCVWLDKGGSAPGEPRPAEGQDERIRGQP